MNVKDSAHLIDPEYLECAFPVGEDSREKDYKLLRAEYQKKFSNVNIEQRYHVKVENIWIENPFDGHKLRLWVVKPIQSLTTPAPLFFNIHGGGMFMGFPEMDMHIVGYLAEKHGFVCVCPDYRLAPEYVQPVQLHDCYAGIKWCVKHKDELYIDTSKIAIAGASAGGGLAAGLALYIRDKKEFEIHHLRLQQPMLDDHTAIKEAHPYNGQFVFGQGGDYFGWKAVLNQEPGSEGVSEYYCPSRAKSLEGLPPTYLSVGAIELFADETLDFAKQLMHDGVPLELHVYPGWHHGSPSVATAFTTMKERENQNNALLRALGLWDNENAE